MTQPDTRNYFEICTENPNNIFNCDSFTFYQHISQYFNQVLTSDLQIEIKSLETDEIKKTYYLHKLVLCQIPYMKAMLMNTNWKESKTKIQLVLFEDGWITEDVLDVLFEMFYLEKFESIMDSILEFPLQLYSVSKNIGFDRAILFVENIITNSINEKNMIRIMQYCISENLGFQDEIFKICIQYLKIFFFTLNMASYETISYMDFYVLQILLNSPDTICYTGKSKQTCLDFFKKSHLKQIENDEKYKKNIEFFEKNLSIIEETSLLNNLKIYQQNNHKNVYFFKRRMNWTKNIINSSIMEIEKFSLYEINWTLYLIHSGKNSTILSLYCSDAKRLSIHVRITVYIISRKQTKMTQHEGTIITNELRLDIINCIDKELLEDAFIISEEDENDNDNEQQLNVFITELEIVKIVDESQITKTRRRLKSYSC